MFDLEKMLNALSPKREHAEIQGFKFYARPMTVKEFSEFFYKGLDDSDRNDQMILSCVQKEDGTPMFETVEQVNSLYTTVRAQLAGLVSKASILSAPVDETEKK
ncbi:hypothetical protein EDF75_1343 [Raoultella sp. BIGb0149]|uniref:cytochrome n=1 Tax=Raoultella sp. BIGb0149 TaxID=2485116 RepID=UPI00105F0DB5|nr:cytochrome [Raoultella sp. BIGb0149]TDQ27276.1 hypothetical protein EDF75_1343 [Raoultella sp. BIGb0149]